MKAEVFLSRTTTRLSSIFRSSHFCRRNLERLMSNSETRVFGVKIFVEFAAAHHIRGYQGDCARPHGHNFKVEVEATAPRLNPIGIALDFKDLKKLVNELVMKFDHQDMNTIAPFTDVNPTAETISQYFYEEL